MAFMHIFCFWCSVRLGAISIAIFTMIQSIIWLVFIFIGLNDLNGARIFMKRYLLNNDLNSEIIKKIIEDPNQFLICLAILFCTLLFTSIFLLIGAYQCNTSMIYPFLPVYAAYLMLLFLTQIWTGLYVKSMDVGLGISILLTDINIFIALFYIYTWFCIFFLARIIEDLKKKVLRRFKIALAVTARNNGIKPKIFKNVVNIDLLGNDYRYYFKNREKIRI